MRFESQYNTSEVEDAEKDAQVTRSSQRGRYGERDERSPSGGQALREWWNLRLCGCVVLREAVVSLINADESRVGDSMSTRR